MPLAPRFASSILALAVLTCLVSLVPAGVSSAAESIAMPFPGGQAVSIIQGYNGGTHQGRSQYGLDLVLADGNTSGAEVVSPIEGSVTYSQSPKSGNGCMAIAMRDGSYSVMLCHVIFHRTFSRGESIARGESLGTVGPAGTVGNNGAPHVHLELHSGSRASNPVPFAAPNGLTLEGITLAATGKSSEHGRREAIVSTNRPGSVLSSTTARRDETTQRMSATSDEPVVPLSAASLSSLGRTIEPSSTTAAATPSTSSRAAVVRGTDSCLNVRASAKTSAPLIGCLAEGTSVKIIGEPTTGAGFTWHQIERAGSLTKGGWVVGRYLD